MMEETLNLKHLKVKTILFASLISFCTWGQTDQEVEIAFNRDIVTACIDRPGDIYVTLDNKRIEKYDIHGNKLAEGNYASPTILDPWYGIDVLLSYKNENRYTITDRNLENPRTVTIDPAFAIEPSLICLAGEKNIWLLDKADMSLKRINTLESRVVAESIIPDSVTAKREFVYMREYQNFLFLQDRDGRISVFNQIGIYLRDIYAPGVKSFNFLGEELYYYTRGQVIYFDLFDAKSRSKALDKNVKSVLLTGSNTILVYGSKIVIQPNNP